MREMTHAIPMTLAPALFLGVCCLVLARRLKISAIILLLGVGILVGPQFLGLIHPQDLGNVLLNDIVSLAVAVILFEGGLTLDIKGYREVAGEIWGLLTKGILVTLGVTTIALYLVFDFDLSFCLMSASLIIVTGPTVIGPLLRRVRIKENLYHLLHWEGVLIDPVGVFIALLCYEWVISTSMEASPTFDFFYRFLVGISFGIAAGLLMYLALKRKWIPDEYLNIFVVVGALLIFSSANKIVAESGLLSVTLAGFVLGYLKTPNLDRIIKYKIELKDLMIGLLFILLAANLDIYAFRERGPYLILMLAVIMLVVRPLNIFISTTGSDFTFKEKMFLSWIAPRGIVAASMASLFSYRLSEQGGAFAGFLEPFTYSVIAGTVVIQAWSARWMARKCGVLVDEPEGWLIIGAHRTAREVGKFIRDRGLKTVLLDTNPRAIARARLDGLPALQENALEADPEQDEKLYGLGNILAITPNEDLNRLICQRWEMLLPDASIFLWIGDKVQQDEINEQLLVGQPVWFNQTEEEIFGGDGHFQVMEIELGNGEGDEQEHAPTPSSSVDIEPERVILCYHAGKIITRLPDRVNGKVLALTRPAAPVQVEA